MEYLVTYGWAILIIAIAVGVLVFFVVLPSFAAPPVCNVSAPLVCQDLLVSANPTNTVITVNIINNQQLALDNPILFANINGTNTSAAACLPAYMPSGQFSVCRLTINLPSKQNQAYSGSLYFKVNNCALLPNFSITGNCIGAPVQTISGSFDTKVGGPSSYSASTTSISTTTALINSTTTLGTSTATTTAPATTTFTPLTIAAPSASVAAMDLGTGSISLSDSGASGGESPYSYQWYNNWNGGAYGAISGCTYTTCSFTPAVSGTFDFYIVADDSETPVATAQSSIVSVTVYPTLTLAAPSPSNVKMDQRQGITLSTSASGGESPYTYSWYFEPPGSGTYYLDSSCLNSSCTFPTNTLTTIGTFNFRATATDSLSNVVTSSSNPVTLYDALYTPLPSALGGLLDVGQSLSVGSENVGGGTGSYAYQWYALWPSTETGSCSLANIGFWKYGCYSALSGATSSSYSYSSSSSQLSPSGTNSSVFFYMNYTDTGVSSQATPTAMASMNIIANVIQYGLRPDMAPTQTPSSLTIMAGNVFNISIASNGGTGRYSYQWYSESPSQYSGCGSPDPLTCGSALGTPIDKYAVGWSNVKFTLSTQTSTQQGTWYYAVQICDIGTVIGKPCSDTGSASTAVDIVAPYSPPPSSPPCQLTISSSTSLATDLKTLCDITIDSGAILTTDGFSIITGNALVNDGTIASTPVGNGGMGGNTVYPSATSGGSMFNSYGGSGGGGGGITLLQIPATGGFGGNTLAAGGLGGGPANNYGGNGATPSAPSLSSSLLNTWYGNGMQNYIEGAGGGGGGDAYADTSVENPTGGTGGSGAFGVYIQANSITAGTVDAVGNSAGSCNGGDGAGGGGGGVIVFAYGAGGYSSGTTNTGGGLGGASCGTLTSTYGGNGGNGQVLTYNYGSSPPVAP
jgi:hypothetical protein